MYMCGCVWPERLELQAAVSTPCEGKDAGLSSGRASVHTTAEPSLQLHTQGLHDDDITQHILHPWDKHPHQRFRREHEREPYRPSEGEPEQARSWRLGRSARKWSLTAEPGKRVLLADEHEKVLSHTVTSPRLASFIYDCQSCNNRCLFKVTQMDTLDRNRF